MKNALRKKLAACVKRGALFMDKQYPGWHKSIDISILDIGCSDDCILGQIFGNYAYGVRYYKLSTMREFEFGFFSYSYESMEILTQHWRAEIISREHRKERVVFQNGKRAGRRKLAMVM